ncbi:MAG TPA: excalibur calcium-binding domain-containing protein [Mycobacterium sp.]
MSVGLNGVSVRERKTGGIVLAVIGGVGLLFALTGAITVGWSGFLIGLGLTVLVLGLGAVIVGRQGWALIGSRKVGAGFLAVGLVFAIFGAALATPADPKVVAPQALVDPLPSTSQASPSSTTSTGTTSSSATPTPTVDTAAVAASAAAVAESQRVIAEQAAQAAAVVAAAEANRVAAEAAAAAQAEADRVASEAAAAAQAEADRLAAQAEADRQAKTLADQQAAQRTSSANTAPSGGFANCAAARAAGAAPVHRGEPGYAPKLDRDNDGVGCE